MHSLRLFLSKDLKAKLFWKSEVDTQLSDQNFFHQYLNRVCIDFHVKHVPLYPSEGIFFPCVLCLSSYHSLHPVNDVSVSVPYIHISIYHLQFVSLLSIQYDCSYLTMTSHLILYIQFIKCHFDFNHVLFSSLIHSEFFFVCSSKTNFEYILFQNVSKFLHVVLSYFFRKFNIKQSVLKASLLSSLQLCLSADAY